MAVPKDKKPTEAMGRALLLWIASRRTVAWGKATAVWMLQQGPARIKHIVSVGLAAVIRALKRWSRLLAQCRDAALVRIPLQVASRALHVLAVIRKWGSKSPAFQALEASLCRVVALALAQLYNLGQRLANGYALGCQQAQRWTTQLRATSRSDTYPDRSVAEGEAETRLPEDDIVEGTDETSHQGGLPADAEDFAPPFMARARLHAESEEFFLPAADQSSGLEEHCIDSAEELAQQVVWDANNGDTGVHEPVGASLEEEQHNVLEDSTNRWHPNSGMLRAAQKPAGLKVDIAALLPATDQLQPSQTPSPEKAVRRVRTSSGKKNSAGRPKLQAGKPSLSGGNSRLHRPADENQIAA